MRLETEFDFVHCLFGFVLRFIFGVDVFLLQVGMISLFFGIGLSEV